MKYSIILTTTEKESEAKDLAVLIMKSHLAACVQILPITSYFSWKDEIQSTNEFLLLVKYNSNNYDEISNLINNNHSYEIPEIISVAIEKGSTKYLNWIDQVTT